GQSLTRPAASLSLTCCQRNWPSDSRKAMRIPLSPVTLGSRGFSLLVPTKTFPPATTGFPYDCEPRSAFHLIFFLALTSHTTGRFFIGETILRCGVPPHIGQSWEKSGSNQTRAKITTGRQDFLDRKDARQALGFLASGRLSA